MTKENKAITAFIIGACLMMAIALTGCKSQSPIVAIERHDSIRSDDHNHSHYEREKEYIHDSIYIHEKGDTVWLERWHKEYKEVAVADTIRDTIKVVRRQKVVEQVKVTPRWAWCSLIACIALVAGIVIRIILRIYARR